MRMSYDPNADRNGMPELFTNTNSQEKYEKTPRMQLDFEMVRDTAHLRMSLQ